MATEESRASVGPYVQDFNSWLRGYRKALDSLREFLKDELAKE